MVYFFLSIWFLLSGKPYQRAMDKSQCCAMEAPYKMAEDLRLSILRDSRVSQFLFILMARLVLKKLYFILLHVWPLRQLGSLMYLQKAQSYIHTYRISVINLRFLFSSPDLLCKLTCQPNVKTLGKHRHNSSLSTAGYKLLL